MPVGKNAVIIGGGIQGCETAEFLIKRGRTVTITEPATKLGTGIPLLQWELLHPWLLQKGVTILTGVKYQEVNDKGLVITDAEGKVRDAGGGLHHGHPAVAAEPGCTTRWREGSPSLHMVGDCKEPGLIIDAIAAGFEVGRVV